MYLRLEDPWGDEIRFDENFYGVFPSPTGQPIPHVAYNMPEGKYKLIEAVIRDDDPYNKIVFEIMSKVLDNGYFDEIDLTGFCDLWECEASLLYYIQQSINEIDPNTDLKSYIHYMYHKFIRDVDYYGPVTPGDIAKIEANRELGIDEDWVIFDANGVKEAFKTYK